MRKIISNTTPILSLLKIDKLDLLKELYGTVIVPFAVYQEIEEGKEKPYYQDLTLLDWIEILNIKNPNSREFLIDLDDGEAEVLILAKEINADLVILDEIMGRRYAKQYNIKITGTIGILLKAKENGLIPSIKNLMSELVEKGTWLNPKLISKVLKMANEEKQNG
jgi:predicted nucleic acid-binding protein